MGCPPWDWWLGAGGLSSKKSTYLSKNSGSRFNVVYFHALKENRRECGLSAWRLASAWYFLFFKGGGGSFCCFTRHFAVILVVM